MAIDKVVSASIADDAVTSGKVASGVVPNQSAFKNLIINGDMSVAQRGTSTASITSYGYYTVDRFQLAPNTMGTWTMSQSTDVPTGQGFSNSLKIDCTTADASPSAGDNLTISSNFEGQMLQYLKKGTSSAESLTLSFWIKTNKTGTYIAELYDNDNTRTINKSFTVSSADTWEKKEITYAGDTTGAFGNDANNSLGVNFWLGSGTTYTSGTLQTSWGSRVQANRAVGVTNLADSTDNELYLTGVQLEVGTSASDFEFLPVDVNLNRCQRYYIQYLAGTSKTVGIASYWTTTGVDTIINFPVEMRSAPSVVATSGSSYYTVYVAGNGRAIDAGLAVNRTNLTSTQLYATTASDTAGRAGLWTTTNSSASIAFSSEL